MPKANTDTAALYPGFEYTPGILRKYVEASGIFTIMLKDGTIVHFSPSDNGSFRNWLEQHAIPGVNSRTKSVD